MYGAWVHQELMHAIDTHATPDHAVQWSHLMNYSMVYLLRQSEMYCISTQCQWKCCQMSEIWSDSIETKDIMPQTAIIRAEESAKAWRSELATNTESHNIKNATRGWIWNHLRNQHLYIKISVIYNDLKDQPQQPPGSILPHILEHPRQINRDKAQETINASP